jgi:hypothetical protein
MDDIAQYRESRGFTIDRIEEKLPGTIIDTYDKLTAFISQPDALKEEHLALFNTYCDSHSAERLAVELGI